MADRKRSRWRPDLPAGIWALGFVSLFMDVSSEMIHALLPVYLVTTLGASALQVGVIEGVAEATASVVKVFSGVLSDWIGRRKLLLVAGYGLGALAKPLFPLASTAALVLTARFVDRIGKGVRGAPRDALVGDLAPPHARGAAFGLRQSLDTVGAFTGPLLAIALMALSHGDIRFVFWVAVVPAVGAVLVLLVWVREPPRDAATRQVRSPIHRDEIRRLGSTYWRVAVAATVLTLGRFSEAFLILRAQDLGLAATLVPVVLVVMNAVYGLVAYPVGALSDRRDPKVLLCLGFAVLILADLVLALAANLGLAFVGIALWGLHMGMTQGLLASLVASAAPADRRGTAFGIFNLIGSVALLAASLLAGSLWEAFGGGATFLGGAAVTTLGLAAAATLLPRARPPADAGMSSAPTRTGI
jgi:MFS family permease